LIVRSIDSKCHGYGEAFRLSSILPSFRRKWCLRPFLFVAVAIRRSLQRALWSIRHDCDDTMDMRSLIHASACAHERIYVCTKFIFQHHPSTNPEFVMKAIINIPLEYFENSCLNLSLRLQQYQTQSSTKKLLQKIIQYSLRKHF